MMMIIMPMIISSGQLTALVVEVGPRPYSSLTNALVVVMVKMLMMMMMMM